MVTKLKPDKKIILGGFSKKKNMASAILVQYSTNEANEPIALRE